MDVTVRLNSFPKPQKVELVRLNYKTVWVKVGNRIIKRHKDRHAVGGIIGYVR